MSNLVVAGDNSSATLTISEAVYASTGMTGNLADADFDVSISGGTATLSSSSVSHTAGSSSVTITLTLSGTPDGTETLEVDFVAASVFDAADNAGVAGSPVSDNLQDETAPTFNTVPLNPVANNSYVDIIFSEGLYSMSNGTGGVDAGDFTLTQTVSGTATVTLLNALANNDPDPGVAAALSAGATTVRFFLTISGDPDGTEEFDLRPSGASAVFDQAGNAMSTGEISADITLNNTDLVTFSSAVINATNTSIVLTFSEPVGGNAPANQNLGTGDFTITNTASSNGGGVPLNNISISSVSHTAPSNTATLTVSFTTGTPDGSEVITIAPNAANSIYGQTNGAMQISQDIDENASDEFDPVFSSVVIDDNGTGNANATFGGLEQPLITVDWGEAGLTVTADLSALIGIYGVAEAFDDNGDGTYEFQLFPAGFLANGTFNNISITAEDAATNSTTNSTLDIVIDSEAPEVTIDQLFTTDDNSAGQEIEIGGTTDDNTMILDVTINGSTYASDADPGFTIMGGLWLLDLNAAGEGTLSGAYDIDIAAEDAEGNTSSESLANGLVVTGVGEGVTINPGSLTTTCIDGDFVTMTDEIIITEEVGPVIPEGDGQTILIALPTGFEYNTASTPTIGLTGTGLSNAGFSFLTATLLEVSFDANSASLAATNSITIDDLPIKSDSLAAASGTLDITYGGGSAVIPGLTIGDDLGDIANIVPAQPNSGNDFSTEYCEGAMLTLGDISAVDDANHIWYADLDDVYTTTILYSGGTVGDIAGDLGVDKDTPGDYEFYVTNDGGTACESEAIKVTITINPNPVAEAGTNLTGGLDVCSGEAILLGGSPTGTGTTGSYTYLWTSNEGSLTEFSDDNLTGQTTDPNPVIAAPTNTNAYGGADATISYTVTVTDGNGCSHSDVKHVEVHPLIDPTLDLNPAGGTYTETSIPVELIVSPAAENPLNEGVFSGSGIVYNSTSMLYEFRPQDVGAGIHFIAYTFTDAVTGCQESVSTNITVTSGAVGATFDNLPNADGGVDAGVCINEDPFTIKLNATDAAFLESFPAPNQFEAINIKYPDGTTNMARVTGAQEDFDSDDEYTFDPSLAFANGGVYGENLITVELRQYTGAMAPYTTNDFIWTGTDQITRIYPLPSLGIFIEDELILDRTDDIYTNVVQNYCEDGGNLVFTATVSGDETASGSWRIRRNAAPATSYVGFGGTIDLSNPLNNSTFIPGQYEVEYTNIAGDDAADFGGSGCVTTTTVTFNIQETPTAQPLDLTGSSKGVDTFDDDPLVFNVDYTFRYCQSETSFETLLVPGVDSDERINWYDSDFSLLGTVTTDGSKIAGSELFQTASAFPPNPDVYTFYYSITDFIDADIPFDGCEGDFTIVQIEVYPDVVNPPIDLTSSLRGEDKSSGSEENYFVFEYCEGETIEGLAVVQDSLTEDFDDGMFPTDWTETGASAAGAALAQGGTGNAIRIATNNTSNEVRSANYQSIQRISFDYRTVGTNTGASFVVEADGNEGAYELGSEVANSNSYQTFEADVLGSLTDADVRIYLDVVGDVDLVIDNFSVSSTIPNKTFYSWAYDNNGTPTFIDGAIDGSDDEEGEGMGVIGAEGNVSALATELMSVFGEDDTPDAGTYTFYVSKIENINTSDTPNFNGCAGDTTRIDIIVHDIPLAPTGFTTDVNVHSGELSINTRLLSTDLVDIPSEANVDYIWSASNSLGAADTINTVVSGIDNPDVSYGTLLSNLTPAITDPSGYYTVTSTYEASAFLFQVANELDRQVATFPGCASVTGTEVDFTIYPLAQSPILTDTSAIAEFNNENSTPIDASDDFGDNLELNFCAGDLEALDSISAVSRFVSSVGTNLQNFTWYRSNEDGDKLLEVSIDDGDGSFATAQELFLTGISNDLATYYLVTQTTDIETGVYDGGESDSVRLKVNIFNIPSAPSSVVQNVSMQDSTDFYYCDGDVIQSLVVEENGEAMGDAQFFWYASEEDALAGTNRLIGGVSSATLTAANMVPDELDFNGMAVANLGSSPAPGTYTFYATQRTNFNETPDADFVSPSFVGCEGEPIEFTIYVRGIPDDPTLSSTLSKICEGEDAPTFTINNRATGAIVNWYESDMTSVLKSAQEAVFDPDNPGDGGITLNVSTTPNDFYVDQLTDFEINGSTFGGCISGQTLVQVTQFRDPAGPDIQYLTNPILLDGDTVGICESNTGALNFTITPGTGNIGTVYNWYQANESEGVTNTTPVYRSTGTASGSDLSLLTETEGLRFFKISQIENIDTDFDGCESEVADRTFLKVAIFDTPVEPTVDAGQVNYLTTGTVTDYYFTYDSAQDYDSQLNSMVFDFAGVNVTESDNGGTTIDESDILTNSAGQTFNFTYGTNTPNSADGTVSLTDLGLLGTGADVLPGDPVSMNPNGSDNPTNVEVFTFTVTQSQFENQHMNPSVCEGPEATVNINVLPVPATPTPAAADVYICDNEVTGDVNTSLELSITNQAAGATVEWWLGAPDTGTLLQSSTGATFRPDAYGGGGTSSVFTDNIDQTVQISVRQITNTQITVQGGTYSGSFSRESVITIEKFAEPSTPTVRYNGTSSSPGTPATSLVAGICEGSTDNTFAFTVESLSPAEPSAYFKWYSTDAAGVIDQLVFTTSTVTAGNSVTVTGEDLNIETAGEGVRYYKVAQVADVNGPAGFDGCETVSNDMQRVQVNIFRSPAFPTFSVANNDAFSTTNNTTEFYLVYDSSGMSLYNNQLTNDVFTAQGANTVGTPGDLTNAVSQEFNWYYNSTQELANDPTADFDDLDMSGILPRDNGSFNNPTTIETFSFEVRQGQFRTQNGNPGACESPSQFVNVNIIPVPDTPTPAADLVELCEDESVSSLSITNRAPGAQVHWFNVDPRVDANADTLNNIADFTYVPTEVEGNAGTYTYYVRQVTNVEIGGTNFEGAVSEVATVTVTIYPNAGVPESTASDNIYVYCLGDRIENLQVLDPENGVTYAWYGDINLNSFLGNTTSANNNLIPDLNGAFDANTVGTYNYYVTSTLAGQGCESNPTLVQIVINGLPDPEIKFNTGITFENEEDLPEFYQICVDESPLEIVGSTSNGAAGTFSGEGIIQNGIRATFDPLLALGIDDPLDMPEFAIDTIYVNYNLENATNCDADQRVGFVVTALPRPNFEASISSPINVPVLEEGDDTGQACVDIDPNNLATVTRMTLRASGGRRSGEFRVRNDVLDSTFAIANGSVQFPLSIWSDKSKTSDTLFIRYSFADDFGCSNFKDKTIILHENPIVEFEHIVGCIGEPVTFSARALAPFSSNDIQTWNWSIIPETFQNVDIPQIITNGDQEVSVNFSVASTYIISVNGVSANYTTGESVTCNSIDESTLVAGNVDPLADVDEIGNTQRIPIGDFPDVDFSWQFITENVETIIEGKETNLLNLDNNVDGDPLNGVSQVWMDWGDGSPLDTLLANEGTGKAFGFEAHTYANEGWYDATLWINTINGCDTSQMKTIKILPQITVDPTLGIRNDFETSTESESGWFIDLTKMGTVSESDASTTWRYQTIVLDGFEERGAQGWTTNVDGTGYISDPGSWIFSPSYDISAFEKPMMVFDGFYQFGQNDGAIVQYSTDNGDTWNKLGRYLDGDDQGTGLFWYNALDIRADPGRQRNNVVNNASGWGGSSPSAVTEKASFRHKLDEIPENERGAVRFRFYFASTSASDDPGFIFDDFEIVERGRISLIEQFSNSNNSQDRGGFENGEFTSLMLNNEINSRLDSTLLNNNDLVAINYYTEIYGNDPLFEISKDGPSSRSLFYGVDRATSVLDGNVKFGANLSVSAATPPWTGAESNRNTLRDADFDLQLTINSTANDELSVTANVTTVKDGFEGQEVRLYLAVVEKVLTGVTLPNGEFDPRNVFRDFLPSPEGHVLTNLEEGGVNALTEAWKIDARKVLDPDQLAVVAFVQRTSGDREVYQAARVDINGKTSVLGVGDLIELDDLNLYPNPASDAFFVTFDLTLEEDFEWRLFDQQGRLVKDGEVFKGMDGFKVETTDMTSGLYLMSIGNETKQYTHLKVIVKH